MAAAKFPFQEIDFREKLTHMNIFNANKIKHLLIPSCKTKVNILMRTENRFAKQFDHQKYFR